MMYKIFLLFMLTLFVAACNRTAFVEHKVSFEKKADDCTAVAPAFRLNSNFGGERYEFEKCLPKAYTAASVISERHGDTVLVKFPVPDGTTEYAAFQVTLDIDSYPAYSFLTIDQDTYTIVPSNK